MRKALAIAVGVIMAPVFVLAGLVIGIVGLPILLLWLLLGSAHELGSVYCKDLYHLAATRWKG